jgi:hypothetical protein
MYPSQNITCVLIIAPVAQTEHEVVVAPRPVSRTGFLLAASKSEMNEVCHTFHYHILL